MNPQLQQIKTQLEDVYNGDPWFGRPAMALISDITHQTAFQKPAGQHSQLELLWHMVNWREFTLDCLLTSGKGAHFFEEQNWRELDHKNEGLWAEGVDRYEISQTNLAAQLTQQTDALLVQTVPGRTYTFRQMLEGIIQHDIYHLGQIAYLQKLLK